MSEHFQAKSEQKSAFLNRIEYLRSAANMTWAEVAAALGISRTQLHLLRKGESELNQRVLLRLEQAEVTAGLRKASRDKQGILRLLESSPFTRQEITESDHDAGLVEVPVEYRRGSPPAGMPEKVPVKAPDTSIAANLLVDLLLDEDFESYLGHCLPPQFTSKEFLNRLTPASFLQVLDAAMEMSLGANWRARFSTLSQKAGLLSTGQPRKEKGKEE